MKQWLLGVLITLSTQAFAEQTLLQQMCETTAFNQELTVTMDTPVVIANHRNGRLVSGQEAKDMDLSRFAPLLVANNSISDDCLAYLQHRSVLKVSSSKAKVTYKGEPILARVFFHFDRSQLSETSVRILDHIAEQLKNSPNMVTLEGHTDAMGSKEYNLALGLRRSQEVEKYLIAKGINPNTMQAMSKGESQPVSDNATQQGREKNRRVEIKI
ncbi:OmpA family protein [Vibrio tapetis]|uniref:Putative OmpA/MotB domain protein n=1 Tax=Vibrio tapetis subsp. tapetis TaxID=1671868 RepID=A0A2N8ZJ07_9VIBR|nr:OmpA family protein [Vibrio tapetis]SON51883.1 putative OmpA/MotB domain protein [Vibrio tapetis subsp. tapetis]